MAGKMRLDKTDLSSKTDRYYHNPSQQFFRVKKTDFSCNCQKFSPYTSITEHIHLWNLADRFHKNSYKSMVLFHCTTLSNRLLVDIIQRCPTPDKQTYSYHSSCRSV